MHYLVFKDQSASPQFEAETAAGPITVSGNLPEAQTSIHSMLIPEVKRDNKSHRCDEHRNRKRLFTSDCYWYFNSKNEATSLSGPGEHLY